MSTYTTQLTAKQIRFLNKWVDREPSLRKQYKAKIQMGDILDYLQGVAELPLIYRKPVLTDVTVGGADNFVLLSVSGSETPSETASVGAVTTEGAVVAAHGGTFGTTHSVTEVAGSNALNPYNLVEVRDSAGDPIMSSNGKQIFGLLQSEVATDGHTFNDTTQQVQISFVEENIAGTDLVATAAADIQGTVINYSYSVRACLANMPQDGFINPGVFLDSTGSAGLTTTTGAQFNMKQLEEEHTLAAAATSATTISIPANCIVMGVTARVTTEIVGPASWRMGQTIVGAPFDQYGPGSYALTAGTTVVALNGTTPQNQLTASTITFEAQDGVTAFSAGVIRVVVNYMEMIAPTS